MLRIKIASSSGGGGVAACMLLVLCAVSSVNSFTKYGRTCKDIGCSPSEHCVMTTESCSFGKLDGKDCGSYPSCERKGAAGGGGGGSVSPSGASLNPGPENTLFSPSSNPTLNTNMLSNNGGGSSSSSSSMGIVNGVGGSGRSNPAIIDPHYVFGAPQSAPIIPNLPIFPFNSPTQPPAFQQFPQANHPGNIHSPGYIHGLQPVNPYNAPFVFGQQPYYNPSGTGGPPGGGGGLAPPGAMGTMGMNLGSVGGFQNPNMFNKPPPQYLPNQNPYNRQTQPHPSSSAVRYNTGNIGLTVTLFGCSLGLVLWQKLWANVVVADRT